MKQRSTVSLGGGNEAASEEVLANVDAKVRAKAQFLADKRAARDAQVSPPGALGLPSHLDAARIKYRIIDSYFRFQPTYDTVKLFRIDRDGGEAYKGTSILQTEADRAFERNTAPSGVIVAGGLAALDVLYHHGMQLGDVVEMASPVMTRVRCGVILGQDQWGEICLVGDIRGSEDLSERIAKGEVVLRLGDDGRHYYERNGQKLEPIEPYQKVAL
jgi:hypothetical protein